ncbi:MAG: sodium:proton antiporter [Clostridiales bacterium]|nr:sodium:proton antiporter [Clostridiales bacterium]
METITLVIVMVVLVLFSYIVHVFVKKISMPLIQIVLGILIILLPFDLHLEIETELFMLLFIAPILFMDGKKFKLKELNNLKEPIVVMALGLVVLNVAFCGFLFYMLIDGIPLAVAFLLAAVLSPTDAVSVKAITDRIPLPERLKGIVEGESLFNDATALIAYNFARIAAVSGIFIVGDVIGQFAFVAFGGILAGFAGAFALHYIKKILKQMDIHELNIYTLLQIITPFLVFMGTEHIGASGILAVVTCGIVNSRLSPRLISADEARIRFNSEGAWETLVFMLNGLVFIMLGMLVAETFIDAWLTPDFDVPTALAYTFAVTLIFGVVRFVYSYICIGAHGTGKVKNALILSVAGVRGALTLAICLAIPMVINTGEPFPGRELILFISSGVILLTLVIANIFLPKMASESETDGMTLIHNSLKKVVDSAMHLIYSKITPENRETVDLLLKYFDFLLKEANHTSKEEVYLNLKEAVMESLEPVLALENKYNDIDGMLSTKILDKYHLEFIAIEIQKKQIELLTEQGEIDIATAYRLRSLLSLEEAALFEDDMEAR